MLLCACRRSIPPTGTLGITQDRWKLFSGLTKLLIDKFPYLDESKLWEKPIASKEQSVKVNRKDVQT